MNGLLLLLIFLFHLDSLKASNFRDGGTSCLKIIIS